MIRLENQLKRFKRFKMYRQLKNTINLVHELLHGKDLVHFIFKFV